jgi:Protein of unknown function (DUF3558)
MRGLSGVWSSTIPSIALRRARAASLAVLCGLLLSAGCAQEGNSAVAARGAADNDEASSGGATAQQSQNAVDPCALVTKEEAEAALGLKVGEPEKETLGGSNATCTYTAADNPGATVSVDVYLPQAKKESFTSLRRNIEEKPEVFGPVEALSGIGDEAYTYASVVSVFQNNRFFEIAVELGKYNQPANRAAAKPLAQKAASRMPK